MSGMVNGHAPEIALSRQGITRRRVKVQQQDIPQDERQRSRPVPKRMHVLTMVDCAASAPRDYILKGLIARGDLGVLFGPPGAGKSVVAPYLAHAVAMGREVFGRRVRQGVVLYVAAEDGAGMKLRVTALRQHGDTGDFLVVADPVDLMGDGETDTPHLDELRDVARRLGAILVVVDTLAAAFPGLDENDGRSMGRVVKVLRELGAPAPASGGLPAWAGAAVVAVHHAAKGGGTTPRGHGVLDGAADVTMRIEMPEDRAAPRTVKLGKNRNGSSLDGFAFIIRAKTLGQDEDGDSIMAPVAEEAEVEHGRAKAKPLSGQQRTALHFLVDAVASEGAPLPSSWLLPAVLRGVPLTRWFQEAERQQLSTSDNPKNRRDVFNRIAGQLRDRNVIAMREGWVWPV